LKFEGRCLDTPWGITEYLDTFEVAIDFFYSLFYSYFNDFLSFALISSG